MSSFKDYLDQQITERLTKERVVVWYDSGREFEGYLQDLGLSAEGPWPAKVCIGSLEANYCPYDGSYYELRCWVEPLVAKPRPEPLLIYLAGETRDHRGSFLTELELAGGTYEPQLRRMARHLLKKTHTDGVIDEMLKKDSLSYNDVQSYVSQSVEGESPSSLRLVFSNTSDTASILGNWITYSTKDAQIQEKEATSELFSLILNRTGLDLGSDDLPTARQRLIRYLMVGEFRADLKSESPENLARIPQPEREYLDTVRRILDWLRSNEAEAYEGLADKVQEGLGLQRTGIKAMDLGSVDTFRFEEEVLLDHCAGLLAASSYADASQLIEERRSSFWVTRSVKRGAQWEACLRMAELGLTMERLSGKRANKSRPDAWVSLYTEDDGLWKIDQLHRQMEACLTGMPDEPVAEQAWHQLRQRIDQWTHQLCLDFSKALEESNWHVENVLSQPRIHREWVAVSQEKTAWFWVDAMRYEMGRELMRLLDDGTDDLQLVPAMAMLPSITEVGMAALLPGADTSYSVAQGKGKQAQRIGSVVDGKLLLNSNERMKVFKASVPDGAEMTLDSLLAMANQRPLPAVKDARLLLVRSQEIDALGENVQDGVTRQAMDTILQNLNRAIRKLARHGFTRFVITSDHGHLFTTRQNEDMKTAPPEGDAVDLHRRCWAGRGGNTPSGCVRLTSAQLGYEGDLDFVFPLGRGVFNAGGSLSYHHGGISLQEMVIPVVSCRMKRAGEDIGGEILMKGYPEKITNRIFTVNIDYSGDLMGQASQCRVVLLSKGVQVGEALMMAQANGANFDKDSKILTIEPAGSATLGLQLIRDDVEKMRIAVLDPMTDNILNESKDLEIEVM